MQVIFICGRQKHDRVGNEIPLFRFWITSPNALFLVDRFFYLDSESHHRLFCFWFDIFVYLDSESHHRMLYFCFDRFLYLDSESHHRMLYFCFYRFVYIDSESHHRMLCFCFDSLSRCPSHSCRPLPWSQTNRTPACLPRTPRFLVTT